MATIAEHNNIVKVLFGHGTHYKHVLTNDAVRKIADMENRFAISRLPVCANCERLGLWHTGHTCYCEVCGTITKKPITLAEYSIQGYDIDPTGLGRDRGDEMKARDIIL